MHSSASATNAVHFVGSILILKQTEAEKKNQQAHLAAVAAAAEAEAATEATAVATFAKSLAKQHILGL